MCTAHTWQRNTNISKVSREIIINGLNNEVNTWVSKIWEMQCGTIYEQCKNVTLRSMTIELNCVHIEKKKKTPSSVLFLRNRLRKIHKKFIKPTSVYFQATWTQTHSENVCFFFFVAWTWLLSKMSHSVIVLNLLFVLNTDHYGMKNNQCYCKFIENRKL